MPSPSSPSDMRPRVGLFVTCLVDLFRPSVGFAALRLLEQAGCRVEAPAQTCCGQPAWNAGDRANAAALARQAIAAFETYDYVVAPSGSCAGMIREHYPRVLAGEPAWRDRARALAGRTHELAAFLTDIRGVERVPGAVWRGSATYHDSCAGLRELGIKQQPRRLLAAVEGLVLRELPDAEVCCGFGGAFCVKYPEISNRMVSDKAACVTATGAETLIAGDLGCLLNMAGRLKREGSRVEVRHFAEVLTGDRATPAIGDAGRG